MVLDCYEFGRQLVASGDLDPVYVLVHGAQLPRHQLRYWLVAYWCYYHMGTASVISESPSEAMFWERMKIAASSNAWLRGRERRHFRGNLSTTSVAWLADRGLTKLFEPFNTTSILQLSTVVETVKTWRGFGPWIAFKVADMLHCVYGARIDFSETYRYLFDSPKEGAQKLLETSGGVSVSGLEPTFGLTKWALNRISDELVDVLAPPLYYQDRIGPAEAETILCKWDAYLNGHYHIGEDIHACRKALLSRSKCKTSQKLLAQFHRFPDYAKIR